MYRFSSFKPNKSPFIQKRMNRQKELDKIYRKNIFKEVGVTNDH